jgi:isopenicillin-N epimerase
MQNLKELFLLNPNIHYLNHGSFGACPKPIFDDYLQWQRELEAEPAQFIQVNGPRYLEKARKALGDYIGCDKNDVVFTTNPTYAINIIAKSFGLKPGDEILSTNLEYGALDRTWEYYCEKSGATYVRQPITLPLTSKAYFIEEFFKGLSAKTKAVFISQITSSTGLIFPVKEICEIAKSKGLFTIVDGAHVPGHIQLNLAELKADVYTGACHKWMLTPKGSSFLYVKPDHQQRFEPLIISWGYKSDNPSSSRFLDYHQFNGTRDFSAFLTIPKAIEFLKENNWNKVAEDCRLMVQKNYHSVCEILKTEPLCPVNNEFLGQLCSTEIQAPEPEKLQRTLFEKYNIEIPVMRHGTKTFIRFSTQAYVSQKDIDALLNALRELIVKGLIKI